MPRGPQGQKHPVDVVGLRGQMGKEVSDGYEDPDLDGVARC